MIKAVTRIGNPGGVDYFCFTRIMGSRFFSPLWALVLFTAFSWGMAAPKLSYSDVKNLYKEGEFGKLQVQLERFLKEAGSSAEIKEKIFAYKYLGVTYAAEPEGTHLAEIYFYDLLELAPNVYLSDLYVSSAVQAQFDKTKKRFLKERSDLDKYDEFGNPRVAPNPVDTAHTAVEPSPTAKPDRRNPQNPHPGIVSKHRIWPWVVVGVGVAAGIGVYLWISSQKEKHDVIEASLPPFVTGVTMLSPDLN